MHRPARLALPLLAARIEYGFADRSWTIAGADGPAICHIVFVSQGQATLRGPWDPEAKLRLEQTELRVEQVAYGLGVRPAAYFNHFFKRLTGQSPDAYRRIRRATRIAIEPDSFAAWPSSSRQGHGFRHGTRRAIKILPHDIWGMIGHPADGRVPCALPCTLYLRHRPDERPPACGTAKPAKKSASPARVAARESNRRCFTSI